jgi:hypothetical protein
VAHKKRIRGESAQHQMARALDDMEEFHKFREELLPVLRQALTSGMTAEEIYTKFQAYAAARTVSIAATEIDSGKALAAIKDILDRTQGKAKERSEVTHRLANAPEEQLDALIMSKLAAATEDEAKH